jgi:hypothetical protein
VTVAVDAATVGRPPDPAGIMVISAWLEVDATADGLRARLRTVDVIDRPAAPVEKALSGIDGICDEVRRWLEGLGTVRVKSHPD